LKKKQRSAPPVKKPKKKEKVWNFFITTFTIVLFGVAFFWMFYTIYSQERARYKADEKYKASMPTHGKPVSHDLVCMVNNMYMGSKQIAVPVNNKTYYGCCQKCVKDLNTDESTRFAVDPCNKKTVDKAMAYITIKPDQSGAVLYFESEENAKKYLDKWNVENL
jgi:YHS domain-containing protein